MRGAESVMLIVIVMHEGLHLMGRHLPFHVSDLEYSRLWNLRSGCTKI